MLDEAPEERPGGRLWLWLVLVAAAATILIVALVVLLDTAGRQRDAAVQLQERSSERIIIAATVDATMARSEAALGRFVISGDRALGGVYADAWRRSATLLDRLAAISRADQPQSRRIARLRAAWQVRGDELRQTALRTTYRQNNEALATYYRIRTSSALTALDAELAAVIAHERKLLAVRSNAADDRSVRADLLATIVSIVGIILLAGVAALAFIVLISTQRHQREETRNAELEAAVAVRTTELSTANALLMSEMATREAAEEQLRQAQKMDAVGQLTGGIAHDFNNMLAVVLGGVELAKRRMSDGKGDPTRHLDSALEGATRAAALTRRLLAFARAEPLETSAIYVDRLIEGMADLLDRTLGERIGIEYLGRSQGWAVFTDRGQLENAILNLAVNARDAMEAGGRLTIATAQRTLRDGDVADLAAGEYLRITVSDTGEGIGRDVLDRIFEPFFTTKPVGKGTGLGLSQVFGFARQSGGVVTVESVVGTGTTVAIYLPRHLGEVAFATDPGRSDDPTVASVRLLVVEDDRRVLAATVAALEELGHRPVACLGIDRAVDLLREHSDIAMVVSDVLMPGLTGPELVARLRTVRPDLRVLYVTGFSGETNEAGFGDDPVLRKPFTISALGQAIDRALSQVGITPLETRAAA